MTHISGSDRSQQLLLPEAIDDYVAADNPVRFIEAFVDALDLKAAGFARVEAKATGRPGYAPGDRLKLYIYGYLNRIQSSRRLERETNRNIELMWLTGRLAQDFKTIADFRRDNGPTIRATCAFFLASGRPKIGHGDFETRFSHGLGHLHPSGLPQGESAHARKASATATRCPWMRRRGVFRSGVEAPFAFRRYRRAMPRGIRRYCDGSRQHAQLGRAIDRRDVRLRAARRCGRIGPRRLNRGSCLGTDAPFPGLRACSIMGLMRRACFR